VPGLVWQPVQPLWRQGPVWGRGPQQVQGPVRAAG